MVKNSFIDWDGNEIEVQIPVTYTGELTFSRPPLTIEFRTSGGVTSDFPAFMFRELTLQLVSDTDFQYKNLLENEIPIIVNRNGVRIFAGKTVPFDYSEPVTPAPYITTLKAVEEPFLFRLGQTIQKPASDSDLKDFFAILFDGFAPIADSSNAINKFWNGQVQIRQRFLTGYTVRDVCEEIAASFCGTWYYDYELNTPNLFIHDYSDVPLTDSYPQSRIERTGYRSLDINTLGNIRQIIYNDIFAKRVELIKAENFDLDYDTVLTFDQVGENYMSGFHKFEFLFNYEAATLNSVVAATADTPASIKIRIRLTFDSTDYWLDFSTGFFETTEQTKSIEIFTKDDLIYETGGQVKEEFEIRLFPVSAPFTDRDYQLSLEIESDAVQTLNFDGLNDTTYNLSNCSTSVSYILSDDQQIRAQKETIKDYFTSGVESLAIDQTYGQPKGGVSGAVLPNDNLLALNVRTKYSEAQTGGKLDGYLGGQVAYSRELYERFLTQPIIYLDGEFRNDDLPEALERFKFTVIPPEDIKDGVLRTLQNPLLPFLYDYTGDGTNDLFCVADTVTYKAESNHLEGRFVLRRKELPPGGL